MYGDRGLPAKVGYVSEKKWGIRVKFLNGKIQKNATRYGEVKGSEHVLDENWRIPEGCLLNPPNIDDPEAVEKRIHDEILAKGGERIKGHATVVDGRSVSSTELFILPERTKHIRVKGKKPSWESGLSLFGGGPGGAGGGLEFEEVIISAVETLQSLMAELKAELEPGGANFS